MPLQRKVGSVQQIQFENHAGEKLAGTLEGPQHPSGFGMVLGHCFTCSRHTRILSDISSAMADIGYQVLRFDFSGNGRSEGAFTQSTYSKQALELQCAADYIRSKGASLLLLAGHSMGGTAALLAAARMNGVRGVIALSVGAALLSPERLLTGSEQAILAQKGEVPFSSRGRALTLTKDFFDDAAAYELPKVIMKIRCPVLLVYGGHDEMISPDSGRTLKDARPEKTEVFTVEEADHMFSGDADRDTVVAHVKQWVTKL